MFYPPDLDKYTSKNQNGTTLVILLFRLRFGLYESQEMPTTITLKNIPDSVHAALKAAAESNRRSLNGEAIARLEQTLLSSASSAQFQVTKVRSLHDKIGKAKRTKLNSIDIVATIRADRDRR